MLHVLHMLSKVLTVQTAKMVTLLERVGVIRVYIHVRENYTFPVYSNVCVQYFICHVML